MKIEIGNLVKDIKTGITMTVFHIDKDNIVCMWYENNSFNTKDFKAKRFNKNLL